MGAIRNFFKNYGGSILTSGLSSAFDALGGWFGSRLEDKRAEQQHQRTKELMSLQNEYQLAQWNRENVYNDPSAVAERFREAGINPRAVFGSGTSGAGIAGSFGSAPSAISHSPLASNHFAGLGSTALVGARLQAQNQKDKAQAEQAEMESVGKKFDNEVLAPLRAEFQSVLKDKAVSEAEFAKIQAQWEPWMADLRARALEGNIENIEAETETFISKLKNDESYRNLTEAQRESIEQEIRESRSRVIRMCMQNAFDKVQIALAADQSSVMKSQAELNKALRDKEHKMLPYIEAQISLIGNQMHLNWEQIRKWKEEVKLQWSKHKVETALNTVGEVRQWIGMFLPFGGGTKVKGFGGR